jgi:hypothetical protein
VSRAFESSRIGNVAATDRHFIQFVQRAAKDPSGVLASLADEDRQNVEQGLPWLVANTRTIKRQYWGLGGPSSTWHDVQYQLHR